MSDNDRIISNLAILRTWAAVNPNYGMGLSVDECRKAVGWLDEAIEMLKAQQPRLMTLDEVQSAEVVWIEQVGEIVPAIKIYTFSNTSGTMMFAYPYNEYISVVNIRTSDYGKISRCWNKKPTYAQRRAETWE